MFLFFEKDMKMKKIYDANFYSNRPSWQVKFSFLWEIKFRVFFFLSFNKIERVERSKDLIMAEVEVETRSSSFDDLSLRGRRPGDSICFRVFLRSNVLAFVSRRQYQLQWLIEGGGEIKIFPFCRNARTVRKSETRSWQSISFSFL